MALIATAPVPGVALRPILDGLSVQLRAEKWHFQCRRSGCALWIAIQSEERDGPGDLEFLRRYGLEGRTVDANEVPHRAAQTKRGASGEVPNVGKF